MIAPDPSAPGEALTLDVEPSEAEVDVACHALLRYQPRNTQGQTEFRYAVRLALLSVRLAAPDQTAPARIPELFTVASLVTVGGGGMKPEIRLSFDNYSDLHAAVDALYRVAPLKERQVIRASRAARTLTKSEPDHG